ncbi:MAG TPA: hemerythrin domain-containing protein [Chitinophagaceae bacterium]
MANENKPIKRSQELTQLSKEHHEALLLVWKIRQGIRKGVDPERIAKYCRWFWDAHLVAHFQKEEELLPAVLHKDHPLLQKMLDDHDVIQRRVKGLPDNSTQVLELLAQSINDHVRFEERQLFNEVERLATPEQLTLIAEGLNEEEPVLVWEDEFWINP